MIEIEKICLVGEHSFLKEPSKQGIEKLRIETKQYLDTRIELDLKKDYKLYVYMVYLATKKYRHINTSFWNIANDFFDNKINYRNKIISSINNLEKHNIIFNYKDLSDDEDANYRENILFNSIVPDFYLENFLNYTSFIFFEKNNMNKEIDEKIMLKLKEDLQKSIENKYIDYYNQNNQYQKIVSSLPKFIKYGLLDKKIGVHRNLFKKIYLYLFDYFWFSTLPNKNDRFSRKFVDWAKRKLQFKGGLKKIKEKGIDYYKRNYLSYDEQSKEFLFNLETQMIKSGDYNDKVILTINDEVYNISKKTTSEYTTSYIEKQSFVLKDGLSSLKKIELRIGNKLVYERNDFSIIIFNEDFDEISALVEGDYYIYTRVEDIAYFVDHKESLNYEKIVISNENIIKFKYTGTQNFILNGTAITSNQGIYTYQNKCFSSNKYKVFYKHPIIILEENLNMIDKIIIDVNGEKTFLNKGFFKIINNASKIFLQLDKFTEQSSGHFKIKISYFGGKDILKLEYLIVNAKVYFVPEYLFHNELTKFKFNLNENLNINSEFKKEEDYYIVDKNSKTVFVFHKQYELILKKPSIGWKMTNSGEINNHIKTIYYYDLINDIEVVNENNIQMLFKITDTKDEENYFIKELTNNKIQLSEIKRFDFQESAKISLLYRLNNIEIENDIMIIEKTEKNIEVLIKNNNISVFKKNGIIPYYLKYTDLIDGEIITKVFNDDVIDIKVEEKKSIFKLELIQDVSGKYDVVKKEKHIKDLGYYISKNYVLSDFEIIIKSIVDAEGEEHYFNKFSEIKFINIRNIGGRQYYADLLKIKKEDKEKEYLRNVRISIDEINKIIVEEYFEEDEFDFLILYLGKHKGDRDLFSNEDPFVNSKDFNFRLQKSVDENFKFIVNYKLKN